MASPKTLEETPGQDTHWSTRGMAAAAGLSQSPISRIWRAFGLKPHAVQTWKLSTDPLFVDKVRCDRVMSEHTPPDCVVMPGVEVLHAVVAALHGAGLVAALGGSGLLAALGLTDHVRDWDVTTDADPHAVQDALAAAGIPYTPQPSGDGRYATRARLRVDGGDHDIDLIVGFAIRTHGDIHDLPVRVTGHWRGLPLADPAVWAHAYYLAGRDRPAAALDTWLAARA